MQQYFLSHHHSTERDIFWWHTFCPCPSFFKTLSYLGGNQLKYLFQLICSSNKEKRAVNGIILRNIELHFFLNVLRIIRQGATNRIRNVQMYACNFFYTPSFCKPYKVLFVNILHFSFLPFTLTLLSWKLFCISIFWSEYLDNA